MKFINVCFPALFATGALARAVAVPDAAARLLRNQATRDLDAHEGAKPMTILNEEFCQVYYALGDGNCEALRDTVRSEIRGETPTLELGDPSEKPVLYFFHGWPDTYAMWANQFAHFCGGEDAKYACVAPSMMNYNPDVPPADEEKLWWPLQADIFHEVAEELGLKDITLVVHDFGSIVGSMYVDRHPEKVKQAVVLDVANSPGRPFPAGDFIIPNLQLFQQQAIASWRGKNDTAMQEAIDGMGDYFLPAPCTTCKITPDSETPVGHLAGWMHRQFADGTYRSYFEEPESEWEFNLSPTWPDSVPQLFLWGFQGYHQPQLLTWLDSRGDGSGHRRISQGDHWFPVRNLNEEEDTVSATNAAMDEFFAGTFRTDGSATKPMTVLNEEFCQVYYVLDDGNCEAVRDSIQSKVRGATGTPTIEIGDPTEKPVLFFIHGWPDTYAMWANQISHFCGGDDAEYACVAASLMNYNPDVPAADDSKLVWPLQADVMQEVIEELDLKDVTLVIHDFGSIVGAMLAARHPERIKRVVAMDIGNSPGTPPEISDDTIPSLFPFQQGAIAAWRSKNDTLMQETVEGIRKLFGVGPPCETCKITAGSETPMGHRLGWNHEQFVNDTYRSYFEEPVEEWEFDGTPTWPESVPYLFLWAGETFHRPSIYTWLDSRGDGSGHRRISPGDHWFMLRNLIPNVDTVSLTHDAMEEFFDGSFQSDAPATATGATAAPGATTTEAPGETTTEATEAATTAPPADDPPADDKSGTVSSRAVAVASCVVPLVFAMFLA